jgi:DNA-binding GntR family transcriptional regulator
MTGEADWEPVRRVRAHEEVLAQIEQKILRAIEKGDGDRAAELVADHITRFYQDRILNNS